MIERTRVAGIILAAGSGSRLSLPKQLLKINGKPLLQITLEAALDSDLDHVLLVLGFHAADIRSRLARFLARSKLTVIQNPAPQEGMGSSLGLGARSVRERRPDGIMVILGDQPFLDSRTVNRVLDSFRSTSKPVCAAYQHTRRSHPVVFDATLIPRLIELGGDEGARSLLRNHPEWIEPVFLPETPVMDLDTVEDLRRLEEQAGCTVTWEPLGPKDNLIEAFGLQHHRRVALVGAGGKTALMYALARELVNSGRPVITTTSTRIYPPEPEQSPHLELLEGKAVSRGLLSNLLHRYGHVTLADRMLPVGKVTGLNPAAFSRLFREAEDAHVIVEADGAARRSLKAPREHEPVVPEGTSLVVGVMGLSALYRPLDAETVFAPERFARLSGIPMGAMVTPDATAALAAHPEGLFKSSPPDAERIPFLNQSDAPGRLHPILETAHLILKRGRFRRTVFGSLRSMEPVVVLTPSHVEIVSSTAEDTE